jgi:hypothetical protein
VKKKANFNTIWWSWFLFTGIYTIFVRAEQVFFTHSNFYFQNGPTLANQVYIVVAGIFGLFVPIGPLNFILFLDAPWIILILLAALYLINKYEHKLKILGWKKWVLNLVALMFLTVIGDYFFIHCWASMQIIFEQDFSPSCVHLF